MPTLTNKYDTYKEKMLLADIIQKLSGQNVVASLLRRDMSFNPQTSLTFDFGDTITIEKEVDTTYRKLENLGDSRSYDTPTVNKVQLVLNRNSYVGIKTNEWEAMLLNDVFQDNYARSRARSLLTGWEKDVLEAISYDADLTNANTISLGAYGGTMNYAFLNEVKVRVEENGFSSQTISTVLNPRDYGNLRLDDKVINDNTRGGSNTIDTGVVLPTLGQEIYSVLNSGTFNRMPTNTTSNSVSGAGAIRGLVIVEDSVALRSRPSKPAQPGVDITQVNGGAEFPVALRRIKGYDIDTQQEKDILEIPVWGVKVLEPKGVFFIVD